MLVPKRVKHRKVQRGHMRGEAKGGKTVSFGEFGLQALDSHWISNRQIEAARIAITRYMKRGGKVGLRSSLNFPTLAKVLVSGWVMVRVPQKDGLPQLSVAR